MFWFGVSVLLSRSEPLAVQSKENSRAQRGFMSLHVDMVPVCLC